MPPEPTRPSSRWGRGGVPLRPALRKATLPVTFHARGDHVVAVYHVDEHQTVGIRFESMEQLLYFTVQLMEQAAKVWPQHPAVLEYLAPDDPEPQG